MNKASNFWQKISSIYLSIFLAYIVLVTYTKFTSYATQFHMIYMISVIIYITISLVFLLFIRDTDGDKSNYDLVFFIVFMLLILLRIIFKLQIMTFPLLAMFITIVNFKYINIFKIIKKSFYVELLTDISIIVLSLCHIFPNVITYRYGLPRMTLGFTTCNGLATDVLCLVFSYLLLIEFNVHRRILFGYILLIVIICVVTFLLTNSRDFNRCSLVLIMYLLCSRLNLMRNFLKWISIIIALLSCIVAILIPIIIVPGTFFFNNLNILLSNRLVLQMAVVQSYPIKLLGRISIPLLNDNNGVGIFFVDNNYLNILLYCGIVGLVVFEFIFIKSLILSVKSDNFILCGILVSLSLYLIMEVEYFNPDIFIPIIFSYCYYHSYVTKVFRKIR